MTDIFKEDRLKKYANVFMNKEFIEVQTYSNRGFDLVLDPTVKPTVLAADVSDTELGEALVNAIKPSRFLSEEELKEIKAAWSSRYQAWVEKRVKQFGYKTKFELFQDMDNCFILNFEGEIMMKPQYHVELEHWTRMDYDGIVEPFFPEDLSFDQLGAGLRLAFSRCLNKKEKFGINGNKVEESRVKLVAGVTNASKPCLYVYFGEEEKPFMEVNIDEDKELVFNFYAPPKDIKLNLPEWKQIRQEAVTFLSEVLRNEK